MHNVRANEHYCTIGGTQEWLLPNASLACKTLQDPVRSSRAEDDIKVTACLPRAEAGVLGTSSALSLSATRFEQFFSDGFVV